VLAPLIQAIRDNPQAASALAAILGSLVAILAVMATMIATVANFWGTRSHSRATVVSVKRQEWINSLRDEMAKAVHILNEIAMLYEGRQERQQFIAEIADPADPARKTLRALQRDFSLSRARIILFLNPKDGEHTQLRTELSLAYDMVHCPPEVVQGIDSQIERVIEICQRILKSEWEKVKNLR